MNTTPSLAERALLVSYTINQFSNQRISAQSLAKVRKVVAVRDGDTYVQALLPRDEVNDIKLAERAIRKLIKDFTLPWLSGLRMLSSEQVFVFMGEFNLAKDQFELCVEQVASKYDRLLAEERAKRGDDFNPDVYPADAQAFRQTCSVSLVLMPLPDLDDFRLTLSSSVAEMMQQETQAAFDKMLQAENCETFLGWYEAYNDTQTQRALTSLHVAANKLIKVLSLLPTDIQAKVNEVIGYPDKLN